jgi:integrase
MSLQRFARHDNAVASRDLLSRARTYASLSHAQGTRKGYRSDWARFEAWCASRGVSPLPAEPTTVAIYLTHRADEGRKVSTLQRSLAAISKAHKTAGHGSPAKSEPVRRVMRGIKRARGTAPLQKAALSVEELRRMCGALPETTCGIRDRALLLVGFAGAFRRSELVGLNVEDVELVDDGLRVLLRRSKTDQDGEGRTVAIPFGSDRTTCPVRAFKRWLALSGITEGAVFRAVNRGGRIATRRESGDGRLSARDVARVVKRAGKAVGLDPSKLGGHSLRAGLATAAAKSGKSERAIMAQTGHRSPMMVRRYIRDANLFAENAAAGIGL